MRDKPNRPQITSDARKRRAEHKARASELRARKRRRRQRAVDMATEARRLVEAKIQLEPTIDDLDPVVSVAYKTPNQKDPLMGWLVVKISTRRSGEDEAELVGYAKSRDGARKRARELSS